MNFLSIFQNFGPFSVFFSNFRDLENLSSSTVNDGCHFRISVTMLRSCTAAVWMTCLLATAWGRSLNEYGYTMMQDVETETTTQPIENGETGSQQTQQMGYAYGNQQQTTTTSSELPPTSAPTQMLDIPMLSDNNYNQYSGYGSGWIEICQFRGEICNFRLWRGGIQFRFIGRGVQLGFVRRGIQFRCVGRGIQFRCVGRGERVRSDWIRFSS